MIIADEIYDGREVICNVKWMGKGWDEMDDGSWFFAAFQYWGDED